MQIAIRACKLPHQFADCSTCPNHVTSAHFPYAFPFRTLDLFDPDRHLVLDDELCDHGHGGPQCVQLHDARPCWVAALVRVEVPHRRERHDLHEGSRREMMHLDAVRADGDHARRTKHYKDDIITVSHTSMCQHATHRTTLAIPPTGWGSRGIAVQHRPQRHQSLIIAPY